MKLVRVVLAAAVLALAACNETPVGPETPDTRKPAPTSGPVYDGGTAHGSGG